MHLINLPTYRMEKTLLYVLIQDYITVCLQGTLIDLCWIFLSFNATFSNISAISWRPILVVEEAGVPGGNQRPWASNW